MDINRQAPVVSNRQILISATPESVWRILTDINGWTQWHPAVSRAELEDGFVAGSVFRWKSGGFNIASTVREVIPHTHIAWTGKAFGTKAVHTWNFTAQNGGVLVKTEESFEGWLVGLMKDSMKKTLDEALEVWLENLKKTAEQLN